MASKKEPLSVTHPVRTKWNSEDAIEAIAAKGLRPLEPFAGANKPWLCLCIACQKQVRPTLSDVNRREIGCKFCAVKESARLKLVRNGADAILRLQTFGFNPIDPYPGTSSLWKCVCLKCNSEVRIRFADVIKTNGLGCARCWEIRRKTVRMLKNDIAVTTMNEAGLEPLETYPGSSKPWRSRCTTCDTIVFPRYGNIKSGWGGCRSCGFVKSADKNRTPQNFAIAEFEKYGFRPMEPFSSINSPWKSVHNLCGKEVSPTLSQLRIGKGGCGYCVGKRVDVAEAIDFMKSKNLEPIAEYPGSKRHWLCKCLKCGGTCSPSYGQLKTGKQKSGCWRCAVPSNSWINLSAEQRRLRIDAMSKTDLHAEEALAGIIALDLEPIEPFKSLGAKWLCRCLKCKREVSPSYDLIKSGKQKSGCPYCAGSKIDPAEAIEFMKTRLLLPLEPYPGSGPQWRCKCLKCDREVSPRYGNIKNGWGGCAWCTGQKVDPDEAALVMKKAGLEPLMPYPGTQKPWRCRCLKCDREVTPMHLSVSQQQSGCKYCSISGLNWQDESVLYLLVGNHFMKIGIANSKTLGTRLKKHKKWGLEAVSLWDFESGETAYRVEQSVISWWRGELKIPPVPRAFLPDGWTETANIFDVDIGVVIDFVNNLSEQSESLNA